MRSRWSWRRAGAVVAGLVIATPLWSQAAARQQIDSLMADQLPAGNAHDADRFLAAFAHDSTLLFVFNGTIIRGYEPLLEQQRKWWSNGAGGVVYSRTAPPEVTILAPGVALAVDRLASRHTLPSGEVRTGDFVVMLVWRLRPEGWRIVAAHESTVH
ncbi:MAG: YybH family protein [Gemmatimonadales bacterium]